MFTRRDLFRVLTGGFLSSRLPESAISWPETTTDSEAWHWEEDLDDLDESSSESSFSYVSSSGCSARHLEGS